MKSINNAELKVAAYALSSLSASINNRKADLPPKELDWQKFIAFTEFHGVSNTVAPAFKDSSDIPEDVSAFFRESFLISAAREAILQTEIEALFSEFEKKKIPYMRMKGYVLKALYPQPNMRSMSDIDILVDPSFDFSKLMSGYGFSLKESGKLHDSYYKKPNINIELHKSLVDEELADMFSYFGKGFSYAEKINNSSRYYLSDEKFYIYMIAHIAKHFIRMGIGIRAVADVYVLLKAK